MMSVLREILVLKQWLNSFWEFTKSQTESHFRFQLWYLTFRGVLIYERRRMENSKGGERKGTGTGGRHTRPVRRSTPGNRV